MALTKKMTAKWWSTNKYHYMDLGYKFTKMGDYFEVDLKDFKGSVNTPIKVECEKCERHVELLHSSYLFNIKKNSAFLCRDCANLKNDIYNKSVKTRLKNGTSFELHCLNNERDDILERWDYEKNKKLPSEITFNSTQSVYLKCPNDEHESQLHLIATLQHKNTKAECNICESFGYWGEKEFGEDFLEKYWDYDNNIENPFEIKKSSDKKVFIFCQTKSYHNSYKITTNNFRWGYRCSFCNIHGAKVHIKDSLGYIYPESVELWSEKNSKTPFDVTSGENKYTYWKCPDKKHQDFKRYTYASVYSDFRCPKCSKEKKNSVLQSKVEEYLSSLPKYNIALSHEHDTQLKCLNPETNFRLPYDNEVLGKNWSLIIEVHGEQHYQPHAFYAKSTIEQRKANLEKIKKRDKYKRQYAEAQGYDYLEIPYWTDDKEETWKKLIEDKLKEIEKRK